MDSNCNLNSDCGAHCHLGRSRGRKLSVNIALPGYFQFVAHPNVQQLLASIWYEGLPGFRRKNMFLQALEIVRIGILFPFFSVAYIIAPHSVVGQTMRKPFIKFICNSASYFTFLCEYRTSPAPSPPSRVEYDARAWARDTSRRNLIRMSSRPAELPESSARARARVYARARGIFSFINYFEIKVKSEIRKSPKLIRSRSSLYARARVNDGRTPRCLVNGRSVIAPGWFRVAL